MANGYSSSENKSDHSVSGSLTRLSNIFSRHSQIEALCADKNSGNSEAQEVFDKNFGLVLYDSPFPLLKVLSDLMPLILSFLKPTEIANMSPVCKVMNRETSSDFVWNPLLTRYQQEVKEFKRDSFGEAKKVFKGYCLPELINKRINKGDLTDIQKAHVGSDLIRNLISSGQFSIEAAVARIGPNDFRGLSYYQVEGLKAGLTRAQVNRSWFNESHLIAIENGKSYDEIEGLSSSQAKGVTAGLTRSQVNHFWFGRSHVEAIGPLYSYRDITLVTRAQMEGILSARDQDNKRRISDDEKRISTETLLSQLTFKQQMLDHIKQKILSAEERVTTGFLYKVLKLIIIGVGLFLCIQGEFLASLLWFRLAESIQTNIGSCFSHLSTEEINFLKSENIIEFGIDGKISTDSDQVLTRIKMSLGLLPLMRGIEFMPMFTRQIRYSLFDAELDEALNNAGVGDQGFTTLKVKYSSGNAELDKALNNGRVGDFITEGFTTLDKLIEIYHYAPWVIDALRRSGFIEAVKNELISINQLSFLTQKQAKFLIGKQTSLIDMWRFRLLRNSDMSLSNDLKDAVEEFLRGNLKQITDFRFSTLLRNSMNIFSPRKMQIEQLRDVAENSGDCDAQQTWKENFSVVLYNPTANRR